MHLIRREKRTVKRIVTAMMPSLLFRCFSLFLPHLRTVAEEKRSQNCLRFGTGGPSLCLCPLLSRNIIFSPVLTMAARAKKTTIDHFTVVDKVTCPLNGSEAGVDLVLIQTSLLLLCKSSCSHAN